MSIEISDYLNRSTNSGGLIVCGIAPKNDLTVIVEGKNCFNCEEKTVVRKFSGSVWYEDFYLCWSCGEDVGTGYRPFKRAWRTTNIKNALDWMAVAVDGDQFDSVVKAALEEQT